MYLIESSRTDRLVCNAKEKNTKREKKEEISFLLSRLKSKTSKLTHIRFEAFFLLWFFSFRLNNGTKGGEVSGLRGLDTGKRYYLVLGIRRSWERITNSLVYIFELLKRDFGVLK